MRQKIERRNIMTLTERSAYIKGLAEGLALDETKPEAKLINELISLVEDMARTISDLEDDTEYLNDYIEEIDEDLGVIEEDFYGDDCDCDCDDCDCDCDDCDCDCDEDLFEAECPSCGEQVYFDKTIDPEDLTCPACGEKFECVLEDVDPDEE